MRYANPAASTAATVHRSRMRALSVNPPRVSLNAVA